MAAYIYNVFENVSQLDPLELRFSTTRKYEARRYVKKHLEEGISPAIFAVTRSRDGIADTAAPIDVYELLEIDLGEVI